MDIFQMMQEVNGLGPVKEEKEASSSPRVRRKTSVEEPPTVPIVPLPRQRLKSETRPPRVGGHGGQPRPKHINRSAVSTTGLPSRGRRSSSESTELSAHSKIKQSASFTSLKDKK